MHGLDGNIKTWTGLSVEESIKMAENGDKLEKVRPWCGQPSDRGRLKKRTEQYLQVGACSMREGDEYLCSFAHQLVTVASQLDKVEPRTRSPPRCFYCRRRCTVVCTLCVRTGQRRYKIYSHKNTAA